MPILRTKSDIVINYKTYGERSKQPIVFINSLGADHQIWESVVPSLKDFFVVTYDKRGHGLSGLPTNEDGSIAGHAQDLLELITSLNLEKIILCGVSVGGLIALGLVDLLTQNETGGKELSKLIKGIIFSNTAAKIGDDQAWSERIELVEKEGISPVVEPTLQKWFSPNFYQKSPLVDICRHRLQTTPISGYAATCRGIREADHRKTVEKVTCPTVCIAGDHDQSTPVPVVKALHNSLNISKDSNEDSNEDSASKQSNFFLIESCGHLPSIEQPEKLVGIIESFNRSIK